MRRFEPCRVQIFILFLLSSTEVKIFFSCGYQECLVSSVLLNLVFLKRRLIGNASLAQLGERQTEDLKVTGSSPVLGIFFINISSIPL